MLGAHLLVMELMAYPFQTKTGLIFAVSKYHRTGEEYAPDFTSSSPIPIYTHPLKVWKDGVEEKDWEGDTFDLVCCDCGLTHNTAVMHNTETNEMKVIMSRSQGSTAQYRRYKNSRLQQGKDTKWKIVRR